MLYSYCVDRGSRPRATTTIGFRTLSVAGSICVTCLSGAIEQDGPEIKQSVDVRCARARVAGGSS